jgi:hypothetical protein
MKEDDVEFRRTVMALLKNEGVPKKERQLFQRVVRQICDLPPQLRLTLGMSLVHEVLVTSFGHDVTEAHRMLQQLLPQDKPQFDLN